MTTTIFYLHGFASGPSSKKARFFASRFEQNGGIEIHVPDLNTPTFSEMTISSQVELVTSLVESAEGKIVLIGSSMGGLVATLVSSRSDLVNALVLMAPGFGIEKRWSVLLNKEQLNQWKQKKHASFFHYATATEAYLNYSFVEDLAQHDTRGLQVKVPTIVFHGVRDSVVPIDESINFASLNSHAHLHQLDDDHELITSLDMMWKETYRFLKQNEFL